MTTRRPVLAVAVLVATTTGCKKAEDSEARFRALLARAVLGGESPAAIDRALREVPGSAARLALAAGENAPSRLAALRVLAERDAHESVALLAPFLWDAPSDARLPATWRLRPATYRFIARTAGPDELYYLNKFHQQHDRPAGWEHVCDRSDAAAAPAPTATGLPAASPAPTPSIAGSPARLGDGLCGPGRSVDRYRMLRRADGIWLRRRDGDRFGPPAFVGPRPDLAAGSVYEAAMSDGVIVIAGKQKQLPWTQKVSVTEVFVDGDRDGIADATERLLGTNPRSADSDGDGTPDGRDAAPSGRRRADDQMLARREMVAYLVRAEGIGGASAEDLLLVADAWETAVELPGVASVVIHRAPDDRASRPAALELRIAATIEPGAGKAVATVEFSDGVSGESGRRRLGLRRTGQTWRVISAD